MGDAIITNPITFQIQETHFLPAILKPVSQVGGQC